MEEEEKRQHDSWDTAALPVSDVSAREIRRRKLAISLHSGAKLGLIYVADDTIFSLWYWVSIILASWFSNSHIFKNGSSQHRRHKLACCNYQEGYNAVDHLWKIFFSPHTFITIHYQCLFSQQQSQDDLFQRRTKPKNYILSTIYSMMTIFITAVTRWSITTAERSTCVAVHAVWEVALHLVVRSIGFQIISHISHNSWVSYSYIAF